MSELSELYTRFTLECSKRVETARRRCRDSAAGGVDNHSRARLPARTARGPELALARRTEASNQGLAAFPAEPTKGERGDRERRPPGMAVSFNG
jgi:hypothetical protein